MKRVSATALGFARDLSCVALCAVGTACGSSTEKQGGGDSGARVTECFSMPLPERALGHVVTPAPAALAPYFPTTAFRTATAAEAGMDPAKLQAAIDFETAHSHTQALIVLRGGYVVGERTVPPFAADTRHESYSMAKSFSSALAGIAMNEGVLTGVDQKICNFYPEWDCSATTDPRSRVTLEHAMNVETGLDWHEDWRSNATGTNDTIVGGAGNNLLDYVLAKQAAEEPGTRKRYSTGDPALLSGVFQGATGWSAFQYGKGALFDRIGIGGVTWNSDVLGRTTTYAGLQATVEEFAKLGFLYLRKGKWDSEQVVPEEWVTFTTQAVDPCEDRYRYLWHINMPLRLAETDPSCADFPYCPPTVFANLPQSGFFAEGVFGQFIFVLPSADIVVARVAQDDFGSEYWDEYARGFLELLLDAVD